MLLLLTACGGLDLPAVLQPPSPYEAYRRSLEQADLAATRAGSAWIDAGEQALRQAPPLALPFEEALFFDPRAPVAVAYRFQLARGALLVVDLALPGEAATPGSASSPDPGQPAAQSAARWFVDLFALPAGDGEPQRVAHAASGDRALRFDVERDGEYLLRIQPELLVGGAPTLRVVRQASLAFPVSGHGARDIGSRFGDPRSGGRSHQGVDIFAPRGTPALAARDGWVVRVGTNRLGGNVVWLRSGALSFYYAHLDTQEVGLGARVAAGDALGRVGNTGNAVSTPPHLHFSVHDGDAVDPLPFLRSDPPPAPSSADLDRLGGWSRVRGQANLRHSPSTRARVLARLAPGTAVAIHGAHAGWYRARLPDGRVGYLFGSLAVAAEAPLRRIDLDADRALTERAGGADAVLAILPRGSHVAVRASFGEHLLVRTENQIEGWIAGG